MYIKIDFNESDFLKYIDNNCYEIRQKWRQLLNDNDFSSLDLKDQDILQLISNMKIFSLSDFRENPLNTFANYEMIGYVQDLFTSKFVGLYNCFGGSLIFEGTERHDSIVKGIDELSITGFQLFQSDQETTAKWDINEFIVNSQNITTIKGISQGNFCVISANIIINQINHGSHLFLVRIRDEKSQLFKGVYVSPNNSYVNFTNYRVPRESLLNKNTDITYDGTIISQKKFEIQRWLHDIICISCIMISLLKMGVIQQYKSVNHNVQNQSKIFCELLSKTICFNIILNKIKERYNLKLQSELENLRISGYVLTNLFKNCKEIYDNPSKTQNATNQLLQELEWFIFNRNDNAWNQKCKEEMIQNIRSQQFSQLIPLSDSDDISDMQIMVHLARQREIILSKQLSMIIVNEKNDNDYIWNNHVQLFDQLNIAYGERVSSEIIVEQVLNVQSELKPILQNLAITFLTTITLKNIESLISQRIITNSQQKFFLQQILQNQYNILNPLALKFINSMGIPQKLLSINNSNLNQIASSKL